MRRRGAVLTAAVLAVLVVPVSGCATTTVTGKPTFGAAGPSTAPAATGLAAKPLDEILTAIRKYAAKQKSVHINATVDGELFTEADLSFADAQGVTTVEKKQVQFRTVGGTTYVRRSGGGTWSVAHGDLGRTIQGQTNFQDIVQEAYSFKQNVKSAKPKTPDLIVLTDSDGNEVEVANDPDSPALQAFHLKTDTTKNDIVLTGWSEQELHLEAPPVS